MDLGFDFFGVFPILTVKYTALHDTALAHKLFA